jgi:uncharacterized protein
MSDPRSPDNDPSMDDILASIRKIISDDEARAQVAQGGAAGAQTTSEPKPATTTRAGPTANREDVLLLTDLIEEPSASPAAMPPAAPTPMPLPIIDPARASEMPQPHVGDPSRASSSSSGSAMSEQSLVGSTVAGATSSAFKRLNEALDEHEPAAPQTVEAGPPLGAGGKTIEDLVKEMLRPMLKDWLERNLPPMVERLVEREIARLTRR